MKSPQDIGRRVFNRLTPDKVCEVVQHSSDVVGRFWTGFHEQRAGLGIERQLIDDDTQSTSPSPPSNEAARSLAEAGKLKEEG